MKFEFRLKPGTHHRVTDDTEWDGETSVLLCALCDSVVSPRPGHDNDQGITGAGGTVTAFGGFCFSSSIKTSTAFSSDGS